MKIWHIQTWGAGTPHYLVSAESREEAWKMVEEAWKKKYPDYKVGEHFFDFFGTERHTCQTEKDLIEVKGFIAAEKNIVEL